MLHRTQELTESHLHLARDECSSHKTEAADLTSELKKSKDTVADLEASVSSLQLEFDTLQGTR